MPASGPSATEHFTIRDAKKTYFAAVEALLADNDLPTSGVAESLRDFLVAESADRIVGVIGMEYGGDYGLLRSTAVRSEWRSRGVAGELVRGIIGRADSRGIHALYLLTTTAEAYFP